MSGVEATFSDDGLLTMWGCPPNERVEYTPLPSTRDWGEEAKTHEQASYQTNMLRAMKVRGWRGCRGAQRRGRGTHRERAACGTAGRWSSEVQPGQLRL